MFYSLFTMARLVFQVVDYLGSKLLFFFFPSVHLGWVMLTGVDTTKIQKQGKGKYKEDTHHP